MIPLNTNKTQTLKKSILTLVIFFCGFIFGIIFSSQSDDSSPSWVGYAFSDESGGIDPIYIADFSSLKSCKDLADIYLSAREHQYPDLQRTECRKGCVLDNFLCGEDCYITALGPGSYGNEDLKCRRKEILRISD